MPQKTNDSRLYLAASIACTTAALFGYSVGFIGGVLVLPSFLQHFDLAHLSPKAFASTQARIVLVWLIGAFLGVPLGIPACARLGRRWCLRVSAGLYILGAGCQLLDFKSGMNAGTKLAVFEVGRFVNGLGVGVGTLVTPMYISEISPPEKRGMLMSGYQTVIQLAALIGFWGAFASHAVLSASSDWQWKVPVDVQLVPGVLLFLGTFFIPEAPRFWAERGRWDRVEESLVWLRGAAGPGDEKVVEEMEVIRASIAVTERAKYLHDEGFFREAMKKDVRKRLTVGVGLMVAQNMVGLNALNYFSPVIFKSAGFTSVSSALFLTGMFGFVKLISALTFMFYCVRKNGNRFWLNWGSAVCAVSMLVLSYFVHSFPPLDPNVELRPSVGGIVSVLMVYTFTFAFGVSLGPISWNVASEIFPLHINAKCCALTICTQWLFQGVVATLTPFLLAWSGAMTYLIYGIFCVLTLIWVYFVVPETRGVPLGRAMDEVFGGVGRGGIDDDEEGVHDEERAVLLRRERVRKASFCSLNEAVV